MRPLPKWILTKGVPAFEDSESATFGEQTFKVYGAMNELITEYNEFADRVNKEIEQFETKYNSDIQVFTSSLRQEFQDFINVIDLKIGKQNFEINKYINEFNKMITEFEEFKEVVQLEHIWIKYADDQYGTNITSSYSNQAYMGVYIGINDSSDPSLYQWIQIQNKTYLDDINSKLKNIEAIMNNESFIYEDDNNEDYIKQVPANTLPYACIKKLYGNTDVVDEILKTPVFKAIESIGFNKWDEKWELGNIGESGNKVDNTTMIRSVNYIPVLPNTNMYVNTPNYIYVHFYDINKNWLTYNAYKNTTFTIPANAYYMQFRVEEEYGTTYNNDICINISNESLNGTYKPYKKYILPINSTLQEFSYIDLVNKKKVNSGIVDLGMLNWEYSSSDNIGLAMITDMKQNISYDDRKEGIICSKYPTSSDIILDASMDDKSMLKNKGYIYIRDTSYTDATAFKQSLNGVKLVYELATPTINGFDIEAYINVEEGSTIQVIDENDNLIKTKTEIVYQLEVK